MHQYSETNKSITNDCDTLPLQSFSLANFLLEIYFLFINPVQGILTSWGMEQNLCLDKTLYNSDQLL